MTFLSDPARSALGDAIRAVEEKSAAEVVIVVEPRSSRHLAAAFAVGAVTAFGVLLFLLFSPWPFELWAFVIEPALGGVLVALLASRLPFVLRLVTPPSGRRELVERAAKAAFFDKGARLTQERIGVLVYASVLEREIVVLADQGLLAAVPEDVWRELTREVEQVLAQGKDGEALARAVSAWADPLGDYLPRSDDDVNELADEVHG